MSEWIDTVHLFPAHAGMIPMYMAVMTARSPFPSACGDDPGFKFQYIFKDKLFPAHAGMILDIRSTTQASATFPRACEDDPCNNGGKAGMLT